MKVNDVLTHEDGTKYKIIGATRTAGISTTCTLRPVLKKIDRSKILGSVIMYCPISRQVIMYGTCSNKYSHSPPSPKDTLEFSHEWQVWMGGECPLPEGVLVDVKFRARVLSCDMLATPYEWHHTDTNQDQAQDIIAFRVTGLAPGYEY